MVIILATIGLAIAIGTIYAVAFVMIPTCIKAIRKHRAAKTPEERAELRAWMHTSLNRSAREGK